MEYLRMDNVIVPSDCRNVFNGCLNQCTNLCGAECISFCGVRCASVCPSLLTPLES